MMSRAWSPEVLCRDEVGAQPGLQSLIVSISNGKFAVVNVWG
jgi:hypothetical protein